MKSAPHIIQSTRHLLCTNWEEMAAIHKPEHNLAHWPRPQASSITNFLEALIQEDPLPASLRKSVLATEVAARLAEHLEPYAQGHEEGVESLCHDAAELANSFATLASSSRLRMTFALINNDMCRLFHTDAIELRLLCTYLGPGTLWVPDQYVNWEGMDKSSNEDRVRDMSKVQQFAPFEVGILKGAMYESNDGPAVLHRSPLLSEQGGIRVLLRFDSQLAW